MGAREQAGVDSLKATYCALCIEKGLVGDKNAEVIQMCHSQSFWTEHRAVRPIWDSALCISRPIPRLQLFCPNTRVWLRTSLGRVMKVIQPGTPSSQG